MKSDTSLKRGRGTIVGRRTLVASDVSALAGKDVKELSVLKRDESDFIINENGRERTDIEPCDNVYVQAIQLTSSTLNIRVIMNTRKILTRLAYWSAVIPEEQFISICLHLPAFVWFIPVICLPGLCGTDWAASMDRLSPIGVEAAVARATIIQPRKKKLTNQFRLGSETSEPTLLASFGH